jgi:hypothetical protein
MSSQSIVKSGQQDIVRQGAFDLTPHSLNEAFQLAEIMAKSDLVPQGFKGRPADILIAVQYGAELGLPPLQALSGIAVINGRACIWGDAALGVVQKSGLMENVKEMTFEEIEAAGKAVFWAKRKGISEPIIREFSIEDAKKAGLINKKGPWTDYRARMLQMRARGSGLRDGFADALKGLAIREEIEDIPATEAPRVLAMPRRLSERSTEQIEAPPKQEQCDGYIQPDSTKENIPPDENPSKPVVISDPQRKRLFAIAKTANYTEDQVKQLLSVCGYQHSADIQKRHYQTICEFIEGTPVDMLSANAGQLAKWCKEN